MNNVWRKFKEDFIIILYIKCTLLNSNIYFPLDITFKKTSRKHAKQIFSNFFHFQMI